jgi:ABC-2 type transport system permease protein
MKKILRIARFELSALFFSPVAWLVLIIFSIQCGLGFTRWLEIVGRAQRMGAQMDLTTANIFSGRFQFYSGVKSTLYLYIPLLTMGLMSREISSGSIKLLLSSPVRVRDIVLGKYLAMVAYCLILMGILVLFGLAGAYAIHSMDYGLVICGMIGLFLLICTYSAIGLYMSTLTGYQVVAAISTLAVLALLNFIGGFFQTIEAVRHVTYFLSMSGRTDNFIDGLVSSEDVVYFLIIILLFLFLTEFKLQAGREAKSFAGRFGRYALLFVGFFLVGYFSAMPALIGYWDMTATKTQTLTLSCREAIKKMDKPLRITTYVNIIGDRFYLARPEGNSMDEQRFDMYRRYMPDMKMDYVYYYDTTDDEDLLKRNPGLSLEALGRKRAFVEGMDFRAILSPAQLKKRVDLSPEKYHLVRQLQYGDRSTFLRFFDDMMQYASEQEITAALERLVDPTGVPKIGFLTGNEERSNFKAGDADYKTVTSELGFRHSLINQGFDVDPVSLQNGELDTNWTALVIADPKIRFTVAELAKISKYLAAGGNMLITGEPDRQDVLGPLLSGLGVGFMPGRLVRPGTDFAADFVLSGLAVGADSCSPDFKTLRLANAVVAMPGAAALGYPLHDSLFMNHAVLVSSGGDTWHRSRPLDVDSGDISYDPGRGDRKGVFPLAIALTRKLAGRSGGGREQRIMVVGDADFMSNAEMDRHVPRTENFDFITGVFRWLDDGRFPVDTSRPKTGDILNMGRDAVLLVRVVFFGVLPLLLILGGTILLVSRKRR